jgi:hypothetical protein
VGDLLAQALVFARDAPVVLDTVVQAARASVARAAYGQVAFVGRSDQYPDRRSGQIYYDRRSETSRYDRRAAPAQ